MAHQTPTSEQQRHIAAEQLWLHYCNNVLLKNDLITKAEHRKMCLLINSRHRAAIKS